MAHYHCSIRIIKRSAGRSSVQFSAYIGGTEMYDERKGEKYNHTSKEEVIDSGIFLADRIYDKYNNAEEFWNDVEHSEKANNAQLARTFEIALPHELTLEQNKQIVKDFARSLLDDGMPAVDFGIHQKDGNLHVHFMTPLRDHDGEKWLNKQKSVFARDEEGNKIPVLDENGNQKYRERPGKGKELMWKRISEPVKNWNDRKFSETWRKRVADLQNEALEKAGFSVRVDHRSYKRQGIDKLPQIHEGFNARKMEAQGKISDRCEYNRLIREENELKEVKHQLFREAFSNIEKLGERILPPKQQPQPSPDRSLTATPSAPAVSVEAVQKNVPVEKNPAPVPTPAYGFSSPTPSQEPKPIQTQVGQIYRQRIERVNEWLKQNPKGGKPPKDIKAAMNNLRFNAIDNRNDHLSPKFRAGLKENIIEEAYKISPQLGNLIKQISKSKPISNNAVVDMSDPKYPNLSDLEKLEIASGRRIERE